MKMREIMEMASIGGTCAGAIAPVESALGGPISRSSGSLLSGKYSTDATPNTPKEFKRYKKNARGQFKNSIGN